MSKSLAIENKFGNVDLTRTTLSKRYQHVSGKRLQPMCRKLGIRFAEAVVGFEGSRRIGWRPKKDGVIVSVQSADKLRKLIEERDARKRPPLSPEKRSEQKRRRQEQQSTMFAEQIRLAYPSMPEGEELYIARHATEIGSGRIGRTKHEDAVRLAVIAYVRHEYTEYDSLLEYMDRDEARGEVYHAIQEKIEEWSESPEIHSF